MTRRLSIAPLALALTLAFGARSSPACAQAPVNGNLPVRGELAATARWGR
ncbi:hypothetical protein [Gemmatimonas sp.]